MKNGTVIWKAAGIVQKGVISDIARQGMERTSLRIFNSTTKVINEEYLEPFNDGKYLHYTRFHPQLKDMIGTKGYFYDFRVSRVGQVGRQMKMLGYIEEDGYPRTEDGAVFAFFAVPIKPGKTEITLQEIADKFGVDIEQLRIKE